MRRVPLTWYAVQLPLRRLRSCARPSTVDGDDGDVGQPVVRPVQQHLLPHPSPATERHPLTPPADPERAHVRAREQAVACAGGRQVDQRRQTEQGDPKGERESDRELVAVATVPVGEQTEAEAATRPHSDN